jgi:uncharacterized protein (TIGR02266 family)
MAREQLRASAPSGATKVRHKTRAYRRVAVRCGCWLEHEQATVFGSTVDVGRGGLFLRTALPMATGMAVRVTLQLPGSEPVIADAKVVRAVAARQGDRPGLGLRFECLPEGEDSLSAFLFGTLDSDLDCTEPGTDPPT